MGFYRHLLTYLVVNLGLFGIDYLDNGDFNWAYFPLIGWGVGLFAHFLQIRSFSLFSVEREKERLRRKNP